MTVVRLTCRTALALVLAGFATACAGDGVTPTDPGAGGTLTVAVTGLPSGASAAVTLTGEDVGRTITGTTTISIPPGEYTLHAGNVSGAGATWYPAAAAQSLTIATGQTFVANVRYGSLPVSGAFVQTLELFDSAMVAFMTVRGIRAGVLTLSRQGNVVYSRAFGWKDAARTQTLGPNAMFRLASVSKPMTSAAIHKLVVEGAIAYSTRVFDYLALAPAGNVADARIYDITVQHLLNHSGGWNRAVSGDIVFQSREIAGALGLSTPPSNTQVAQWAMTQPLQFTPGASTSYSNFGYSLLALVIEKAAGQTFVDYVRQSLFDAGVAAEVAAGRSLPQNRDPREPHYSDPYMGCSVFVISSCVLVPWPDGGWYLEAFDGCGGLVASAPAVASFLESYWISGYPRTSTTGQTWTFFGSLDGVFTVARQRPDGVNIVALFNQRTDASGLAYQAIQQMLDSVSDRIGVWP